ncbi:DnaA/Hda family protein [Tistrella sp. BH-R2-4]|uniref:DnaA/Hda family protein n=1 Tax=Tistrella arctica TaxID=3133430 RepID=A0ABU9YEJ8_9PROT
MIRRPAQLPLDLTLRPALGREDFLVAPSNADAVAWLDRWPAWPGPALAIHGPAGCGKTHLARVWQAVSSAVEVTPAQLTADAAPSDLLNDARAVLVEDVGEATGVDEAALFHLYNHLAAIGGTLLLTGVEPPARWPLVLPDLASRLRAAPAVRVGPPDDALLMALLVKLFADRQLRVGEDVIRWLAVHMERSFDAARRLVDAIDQTALAEHRPVTVALARGILDHQTADAGSPPAPASGSRHDEVGPNDEVEPG